jgi:hypothetical protein
MKILSRLLIVITFALSIVSCAQQNKSVKMTNASCTYQINYLESSMIDSTASYERMTEVVAEPREDLTITDNCTGELVFEYKD